MSGQRPAFLVGPGFLGVLSFKGAAQNIFNALIAATGKAFVDKRLKVGRDVQLHDRFSILRFHRNVLARLLPAPQAPPSFLTPDSCLLPPMPPSLLSSLQSRYSFNPQRNPCTRSGRHMKKPSPAPQSEVPRKKIPTDRKSTRLNSSHRCI